MSTVLKHRRSKETATGRLNLRIAPVVKKKLQQAARLQKHSLSEFIVIASQDAADAVLAEQTRFVLPEKQWAAFNAALDAPAKKIPALRRLLATPSVFETH